ncbi:MAG: asparagine synthase-related protein, partial [Flavobacteriales bacterium]|nr:asparagine synthase-related protein [Flavobacteriales bacterium]
YTNLMGIFNDSEKKQIYYEKIKTANKINISRELNRDFFNKKYPYMNRVMNLDTEIFLAEDMLMKADKSTMAFSVEERVPLLDHNISEISSRIPPHMKIKYFNEKYILKKAVKGIVPKQTIQRKKTNFFVPINEWFNSELLGLTKQMLSRQRIMEQGIFDYKYIGRIWEKFNKSSLFYSRQLWSLLCFQLWHKMFIEEDKIKNIK